MGEVWRARHRMLARPAAIKLIRPSLGVRRPLRGGGTAIRARSAGHRQPALAAHGGALRFRRRRRRHVLLRDGAARRSRCRRARPALRSDAGRARRPPAVARCATPRPRPNRAALVHRDIKPANIFLCRYGEDYDFVKVLDFGLVKATGDRGDTRLRAHGGERHPRARRRSSRRSRRSASQTSTHRVDIYATGCVAYWLLTGQLVFTADTPMKLLMNHVHTPPTPPSARTEHADSRHARSSRAVVPREGSGGEASVGQRTGAASGGRRERGQMDRGAGPRLVDEASARAGVKARTWRSP